MNIDMKRFDVKNMIGFLGVKRPSVSQWMCALLLLSFAFPALAQDFGDVFGNSADTMRNLYCAFVSSPILAVIVAICICVGLYFLMTGEKSGMMSNILRIILCAAIIPVVPAIVRMFGWNMTSC